MKIIVPSYFYPTSPHWQAVINQAVAVEYAIINPGSGPGAAKDRAYAATVVAAQARGISILGYIATTYGAKPEAAVMAEIKNYQDWYAVDGFFFDEAASTTDKLDYYSKLYASTPGIVVLNPGAYPHQAYVECADILCVEERGIEVVENRSEELVRWMKGQPPEKFWYIIHSVNTAARMRRVIKKAKEQNVGYIYVTDDVETNPYDRLPVYWLDEVKLL